jgi:UDP-N-acetylmuramoyl-tripeptide--D-alanyl-D-alanine ligase
LLTVDDVRNALGEDLLGERQGVTRSFRTVTNDSRVAKSGELFVALKTENADGHDFIADAVTHGVTGVVVDREDIFLPIDTWAFLVADTRHALGELARFYRGRFPVKSVVVTGNVGKTTTKELSAALLASRYNVLKSPSNFNDEVGLSMTLFQLTEQHERAVLEVGMFELGEIRRLCQIAQPEIAVVLNVGPTHLERLGSLGAIASAKAEAIEALPETGWAVLNADDPYVAAMATKTRARILSFGIESEAATLRATDLRSRGLAGVDFTISGGGRSTKTHSPLPGEKLVINALAAMGVAMADGMSLQEAAGALAHAEVPLRLQAKPAINGATVLDDSYNASPASMLAALAVLAEMPGRRLALLGDMLELGSYEAEGHRSVGERAAQVVEVLYTIGPRGPRIGAAAKAAGAEVRHFESKHEAARELRRVLKPGDILLVKASHGLELGSVVAELMPE